MKEEIKVPHESLSVLQDIVNIDTNIHELQKKLLNHEILAIWTGGIDRLTKKLPKSEL